MILDSLDSMNVLSHQKLIEMLHSNMPARVKDIIVESMSKDDGIVCVLVCTIAFGMGVDCKGVKTIIHLGQSRDVEYAGKWTMWSSWLPK
jgi:superfamily II DNA helicase RecQ